MADRKPVISEMTVLTSDLGYPTYLDARVPDPAYFGFNILVLLGFDGEGAQRFDVFACTPRWLADNFSRLDPTTGHPALSYAEETNTLNALFVPGLVLMEEWSSEHLRHAIEKVCEQCRGPDWTSVALKLTGWMPREYLCGH